MSNNTLLTHLNVMSTYMSEIDLSNNDKLTDFEGYCDVIYDDIDEDDDMSE